MDYVEYSPTGWVARYREGGQEVTRVVEDWDPVRGDALVVNKELAMLVSATDISGYHGLERVGRVVTAVAAPPGWRLRTSETGSDGEQFYSTEPLAGWVVDDQGGMWPVTVEYGAGSAGAIIGGRILSPDNRDAG